MAIFMDALGIDASNTSHDDADTLGHDTAVINEPKTMNQVDMTGTKIPKGSFELLTSHLEIT